MPAMGMTTVSERFWIMENTPPFQPCGDVYKRQMLQRGTPKLDKDGKPVRNEKGKIIYEPYKIRVFNTINFQKSMHFNPFAYIHSEKDILKIVTTLIANTKGEGKAGDDFWVSATRSQAVKSLCTVLVY